MRIYTFFLLVIVSFLVHFIVINSHLVISVNPTSTITITSPEVNKSFTIKIPKNLTARQREILELALEIAHENDFKNPELLQAILIQETLAGEMNSYKVAGHEFGLKANDRYYGVAQIKKVAALDVLKRYPELRQQFEFQTNTDEELIANLILNDEFNITIACKYLSILNTVYNIPAALLPSAYNQGVGGMHNENAKKYSKKVKNLISELNSKK